MNPRLPAPSPEVVLPPSAASAPLPAPLPLPLLKRGFDLLFSGSLLALTLPIFVAALAGIRLEHLLLGAAKRPLFYAEARVSQGRVFAFRKFNIFLPGVIEGMRDEGRFIHTKDLEHDGKSLSLMGKLLQRTYLDELPQLLSILLGEMSVVGPRPRNLEIYEQGLARGEYFRAQLKAGLTGVVQANKGMAGLTMTKQAQMDQEYLEYQLSHGQWERFKLDMALIGRTLGILAKAKGL